jgi:hypothetical protein
MLELPNLSRTDSQFPPNSKHVRVLEVDKRTEGVGVSTCPPILVAAVDYFAAQK